MIEREAITRKLVFSNEELMNKYISIYKRKGYMINEVGRDKNNKLFFVATITYELNDLNW